MKIKNIDRDQLKSLGLAVGYCALYVVLTYGSYKLFGRAVAKEVVKLLK